MHDYAADYFDINDPNSEIEHSKIQCYNKVAMMKAWIIWSSCVCNLKIAWSLFFLQTAPSQKEDTSTFGLSFNFSFEERSFTNIIIFCIPWWHLLSKSCSLIMGWCYMLLVFRLPYTHTLEVCTRGSVYVRIQDINSLNMPRQNRNFYAHKNISKEFTWNE